MDIRIMRRTGSGTVYGLFNTDGRAVGTLVWTMAGPNVGKAYYSHDSRYKPPKIRKLFRQSYAASLQIDFLNGGATNES